MSEQSGRGLPDSHLLPDAVVAFVDAELSAAAQERAAEHLVHCAACAGEVSAQRQARTAVRGAQEPSMSAGFLASLRAIPDDTELSGMPSVMGELAVSRDGQLMAVQRPEKLTRTDGEQGPSAGSDRLGESADVLGADTAGSHHMWRRTAQGAGVVVSGVVLSAIALVATGEVGAVGQDDSGGTPQPRSDVMRAQLDVPGPAGARSPGNLSTSARSGPTTTSAPSMQRSSPPRTSAVPSATAGTQR